MITKGLTAGFLIYVVIVWLIHDFGYLLSPIDYLMISFSCLLVGENMYPKK